MDTVRCQRKADRKNDIYDQCSGGVSFPQISICIFLLIMMVIKVVIAPRSTTTLTANDLIKLNLPRRLIFQGALFGLSFLLNLYLFANMEEGNATDSIVAIIGTDIILAFIPLSLELFRMIFRHAHRTSLALPPQRSLTSPPSGEISLSPSESLSRSPTHGGIVTSFV